jgi:tetratricopeptide (TPR) repeat protein
MTNQNLNNTLEMKPGAPQIASRAPGCRINAAFRSASERRIYAAANYFVGRPTKPKSPFRSLAFLRGLTALAALCASALAAQVRSPQNSNFSDTSTWIFYVLGSGVQLTPAANGFEVDYAAEAQPSANGGIAGAYISTFALRGDFTLDIDYTLKTWPADSGVRLGLDVWPSVCMIRAGTGDMGEIYSFSAGPFVNVPTSDKQGCLRLVRSGGTLLGYYRSSAGGPWILAGSRSGDPAFLQDFQVSVQSWTDSSSFGRRPVAITLGNFVMTADTVLPGPYGVPFWKGAPATTLQGLSQRAAPTQRWAPPRSQPAISSQPPSQTVAPGIQPLESAALPTGIVDEDLNLDLNAAIQSYQSLIIQFDAQRPLAANAIFRLAECYRRLGRTEEARSAYARILREFADQAPLVNLSRKYAASLTATPAISRPRRDGYSPRDASLPPALVNINFAATNPVEVGFAATGLSSSDYWNGYTAPWQSFAGLSNLKAADGTPTTIGLTVQNGAGHWYFNHPDVMYSTYCYAQDFGDVTVTLTNLAGGQYDFYLYGHGGADEANTVFELRVDGNDYGLQSTATNSDWSLTHWVEGAQYVVYRGVAVSSGGAPVTIIAHPGLSRYTHVNGIQIVRSAARAAAGAPPAAVGVSPGPHPPAGLVSWWAGEGNANDSIGANNGVLEGGVTFVPGKVGQAFSFDGSTADVRVPASPSLDVGVGPGMTIAAWIRPADLAPQLPVVEWNDGSFGTLLWASVALEGGGVGPGALTASFKDVNLQHHIINSPPGVLMTNRFQHVAATYDRSSGDAALYLDGAIVAQANLGIFTPRTIGDLYFGTRPYDGGAGLRFAGQIDEVSVYSRALSEAEIEAIHAAGGAGKRLVPVGPSNGTAAATAPPPAEGASPGPHLADGTATLAWQLAQARNELIKARGEVAKAQALLETAKAELQANATSPQAKASVIRAQAELDLGKAQEALWSQEVARLEARLKAQEAVARLKYQQAQAEFKRFQDAFNANAVSQSQYDAAKLALEKAAADYPGAAELGDKPPRRVYVSGEVKVQGPVDFDVGDSLTAGKAILRAGGFADFANRKKVKVVRRGSGAGAAKQTIELDMIEILEKGNIEKDIPLQPGDLIVVPSRSITM